MFPSWCGRGLLPGQKSVGARVSRLRGVPADPGPGAAPQASLGCAGGGDLIFLSNVILSAEAGFTLLFSAKNRFSTHLMLPLWSQSTKTFCSRNAEGRVQETGLEGTALFI